jgi:hypothetical protein
LGKRWGCGGRETPKTNGFLSLPPPSRRPDHPVGIPSRPLTNTRFVRLVWAAIALELARGSLGDGYRILLRRRVCSGQEVAHLLLGR